MGVDKKMQILEKNEQLNRIYTSTLPLTTTYIFELKKKWKRFAFFSAMAVSFVFLLSYLPYALIPDNPLPDTQSDYFRSGLNFIILISIFGSCFFFGDIICAEFGDKTGFITFPIINKYQLIVGKFLGSFTLMVGVTAIFYITLGLLGVFWYGGPVNYRYYYSFGIALLYMLACGSFVTMFSSFMNNVNMTIVSTLLLLLIANMIVDSLVILLYPEFEPIYSLNHASDLISYILVEDFPTKTADRYEEVEFRNFKRRIWLTPTIEMGITIFLVYTIVCIVVAALIFKRRQL
jgi:ABC-type transport system involved in multi-copper enzyme maturation permease subunit